MSESLFQRLRPECVKVTQLLPRGSAKAGDWRALEGSLRRLEDILDGAESLDTVLTDYVLFPLFQVFRTESQGRPSSVSTATLRCLGIVLRACDGQRLAQPELPKQILLLLTNLLERQGSLILGKNANEAEITSLCFCLKQLGSRSAIKYPSNISSSSSDPHLVIFGTLLTILLDVVSAEDIAAARLSALGAISEIVKSEDDHLLLRRFLPGLLSKLVRPFASLTTSRWPFRALVTSLDIVKDALKGSLPSVAGVRPSPESAQSSPQAPKNWLRANGENLLSAFRHLVKARDHPREEVRNALSRVCVQTLELCHESLDKGFKHLLIDCLVSLQADQATTSNNMELCRILSGSRDLYETFLDIRNSNLDRLPSELQSPDPRRRELAHSAARYSLDISCSLGQIDYGFVRMLADSLLATTAVLIQQASLARRPVTHAPDILSSIRDDEHSADIEGIFGERGHVMRDLQAVRSLLHAAVDAPFAAELLRQLSKSSISGTGPVSTNALARMWIFIACLEKVPRTSPDDDGISGLYGELESMMETGYGLALDILRYAPLDEGMDSRSQILALQLLERRAARDTVSFRPELVYALYPVVERVACGDPSLQRYSILVLKSISRVCGYQTPGDLLLNNVDYLVNAVGLRLNSFDVRPETASVLQLAIRLCGPALIPHLADLTDSIFTILDIYHGYPALVTSMFAVLGSILDQTLNTDVPDPEPYGDKHQLTELEVIGRLGNIGKQGSFADARRACGANMDGSGVRSVEEAGPIALGLSSKAAEPLITRVMHQAQFYLTYDAASIRHGVLKILCSGFSALRQNQDTLLPVLNDVWPVLIRRVYDAEPYIAAEALGVVETVIRCAGDFLISRFQDEWTKLKTLFMQHRPKVSVTGSSSKSVHARSFTQTATLWDSIVAFACTLITFIRLPPEMEDDVFAIFGGATTRNERLHQALAGLDDDSLWLSRYIAQGARPMLRQWSIVVQEQEFGQPRSEQHVLESQIR